MTNRRIGLIDLSVICAIILCIAGCGSQRAAAPSTPEAELKTPPHEILITEGDLNKPYNILGQVECTLTGESTYSTVSMGGGVASPQVAKKAKDLLRKVAYTKYGDRVAAIINTKVSGGNEGGFGGALAGAYGARTGVVQMEGIAVEFVSVGAGKESSSTDPTHGAGQRKAPRKKP